MDFRQTSQQNSRPASSPVAVGSSASSSSDSSSKKATFGGPSNKWLSVLNVVVLFGVAILVAGIALVFFNTRSHNESRYVDTSKYQAVFLNNGQVYFGNIASLNNQYVQLNNIYYLTQNSTTGTDGKTTTASGYTLVKLGCQQIHDPYDQMVINRDQVTFWENLNGDGQVAKKIAEFKKTYPNGPDCSQVSTQTQAASSTTQGGTTTTTPTSTTTKQ